MKAVDVVGLGMVTLDILTQVAHLPSSNEVFPAGRIDVQGGGPVATALVALSRLGCKTAYLGTLPGDHWGRFIQADFERYGVDTHWVMHTEDGVSPVSVILVEADKGDRAILYDKGRMPLLAPGTVTAGQVTAGRILHLDGFHLEAALLAAQQARQAGVWVSFDGGAGMSWPHTRRLLPWVDLLVVARQYAANVTGQDDLAKAGPALLAHGGREVVITDGERGCWYWDAGQALYQPAFRVDVVDTTGAGDTFHGAYLYACLQDWPAAQRLEFASAVAAMKCTRVGGRLGIPTLEQALDFLVQHSPQPAGWQALQEDGRVRAT
ncbi:MAG: carbohydrate kinase family protein [Chloroflexi bacterium]|nr:PfkB family carbohydrate kinase [Anaerolineaceae bacterium]NMB89945.1 carbohydrate kinase family protein [Chloroflexota bacterium]